MVTLPVQIRVQFYDLYNVVLMLLIVYDRMTWPLQIGNRPVDFQLEVVSKGRFWCIVATLGKTEVATFQELVLFRYFRIIMF